MKSHDGPEFIYPTQKVDKRDTASFSKISYRSIFFVSIAEANAYHNQAALLSITEQAFFFDRAFANTEEYQLSLTSRGSKVKVAAYWKKAFDVQWSMATRLYPGTSIPELHSGTKRNADVSFDRLDSTEDGPRRPTSPSSIKSEDSSDSNMQAAYMVASLVERRRIGMQQDSKPQRLLFTREDRFCGRNIESSLLTVGAVIAWKFPTVEERQCNVDEITALGTGIDPTLLSARPAKKLDTKASKRAKVYVSAPSGLAATVDVVSLADGVPKHNTELIHRIVADPSYSTNHNLKEILDSFFGMRIRKSMLNHVARPDFNSPGGKSWCASLTLGNRVYTTAETELIPDGDVSFSHRGYYFPIKHSGEFRPCIGAPGVVHYYTNKKAATHALYVHILLNCMRGNLTGAHGAFQRVLFGQQRSGTAVCTIDSDWAMRTDILTDIVFHATKARVYVTLPIDKTTDCLITFQVC